MSKPALAPLEALEVLEALALVAGAAEIEFLDVLVVAQFVRGAVEHDLALLHDVAVACHRKRGAGVLLDEKNGDAEVTVDFVDDRENLFHQQRRQAHRGLVHQDHLRARHQRAADREHLLLAAGKIAGKPGALFQAREIAKDHIEIGSDLAVPAGEGAELEVFQRGHIGDDAPAFHYLEDAAADDLVGIDAVDALALEQDLAARDFAVLGLEQPGDRLQRRRFAGAIGAEQRHDRALGHVEAETAQHQDDIVIDDLDVAHGKERRGYDGWGGASCCFVDFGHASYSAVVARLDRATQYSRDA